MISLPNIQPIQKVHHDPKGKLQVHSVFATIQGEGPLAGTPAVFIRLYGCDLQCPMCDTDYTSQCEELSVRQITERVEQADNSNKIGLVVITGGEPFRQNIDPLVYSLLRDSWRVQIETNGTLYQGMPWNDPDFSLVCSPKTSKVHPDLIDRVIWKYVLSASAVDHKDGLPSDVLGTGLAPARPPEYLLPDQIFLQPADEQDEAKNRDNIQACVESCMKFGYRLGIQMHKIIGVE